MNQINQQPDDDLLALLMADAHGTEHGIRALPAQGPMPVSFAQQRLWLLQQFAPDSAAYNLPRALSIKGRLDAALLERALQKVVDRHDILRTGFLDIDGTAQQFVDRDAQLNLVQITLENRDALPGHIAAEAARPFDLASAPLIRATLLKLDDQEHVLLLTLHHIVSDAWSNPILMHDLVTAFARLSIGNPQPLKRPAIQYLDYARWQREEYVTTAAHDQAAAYWKAYLGDDLPTLALPTDFPVSAVSANTQGVVQLALPDAVTQQLHEFCQRHSLSPFVVLLGAWQVLLGRYSGQQDFTLGVPNATRNQSATHELVGFFVSSQIYRAQLNPDQPVAGFLQNLRQASRAALEHADYPIELLLDRLNLQRSTQANPLFQTLLNWRVAGPAETSLQLGDLHLTSLPVDLPQAKFDLSIDIDYSRQSIRAALEYRAELFLPQTIQCLGQHWLNLLRAMLANPDQRIGELSMLDAADMHRLQGWNATRTDYPLHQPVHALIEQQAQHTPDATALVFAEQSLTYRQLNQQANQLAHTLMALGVGPEVLVGIALERSVAMVVGLLAILKAGGAYVPLDPEYPRERLAYMIEDSGIGLLLTQRAVLSQLPTDSGVDILMLDELELSHSPSTNPDIKVAPENLAYVIYTSGSTGKPKGAGNRHSALTNRLCWMQQAYGLNGGDTVLQKTPFSFDVSVWEFFWPLMTGARLAMAAPGDHRDPAKLIRLIQRHQVTALHFVPSMLQVFLQDENLERCTDLQYILCSGEALPVDTQQQVFAKLPNAALFNLYGPTEAAIDVTHWTCRDEQRDSVPIGRPIANLTTHILDAQLQPVPVGVIGELYLGGAGLARGYHRRPALTAERFVTSPFGDGERLYRTGDLACYRVDGVIEYRGRIDHQVKIRGLRIELGEIENRLLELPDIREAVVVAVGQQLVGYVVPVQPAEAGRHSHLQDAIKSRLAEHLPDYMVPSQWVFLAHMPLSANGKLDRKALPAPDAGQRPNAYVAPTSDLQQRLAVLWQDVLKREQIGVTDNFFDLGGDSIISIQLVSRARQAGIQFSPKELFQCQTIAQLANVARVDAVAQVVEQGPASGAALLLPIQQAFFEKNLAEPQHWNQSVVLNPNSALKADLLEQSLRALLDHHDALRLTFHQTAQGWTSAYQSTESATFELWQSSIRDAADLGPLGDAAQRSLNLRDGPLLRAVLVNVDDGSQRLLLAIHHLVVDGVSWRVLFEDLQTVYRQLQAGEPITLPARTSAFQLWGERLQTYARSASLQAELPFWLQQQDEASDQLPGARPHASLSNAQAVTVQTRLSSELTRQLLQDAPAAYRTQVNDLLLTALIRVISRWTGRDSCAIQLEGHGRETLFDDIDLSRSVGWFTSLYPVKLTVARDLAASIKAVKEQLRAVPDKGIGYGVLRYLGDEAARSPLSQAAMPRITFNYLGQFDTSFDSTADSLFSPRDEYAGAEQSPDAPLGNWLTLNGRVFGGELSMGWTFSPDMFDEAAIQALADDYATELAGLVQHCAQHAGVTPSDFPLAQISQVQLDLLPIAARDIQDIYPLAPMQQGMLFHTLHEQDAGHYLNQMRLDVSGLDPERFRQAWQAVIDQHDILRTSFIWRSELEQPLQVVRTRMNMPFSVLDWRTSAEQQQTLDERAQQPLQQGFDLSHGSLLNLIAVGTGNNSHHLILTHHHILMDGWSTSQLLGEVLQRYSGQTPAAHQGRYRDYIDWLQQQDHAASEAFWRNQFKGLDEPSLLAQHLTPPAPGPTGHTDFNLALSVEQTADLNEFARQQKVTLNTLLQGAWSLMLQRYTGQQTLCFGATVAGRPTQIRGIEQQVGLFINTLPVVSSPRPELIVSQWLQALQGQNLNLREHEHSALADVQRWAGQAGEALFDTLLVFENYPISEALEQGAPDGLRFANIRSHEQTHYPLTLIINASERLSLRFNYAQQRFSAGTIQAIAEQTLQLLNDLREHAEQPLGALPVSTSALGEWNPDREAFPVEHCIHQRLENQAARSPNAIAVTCDGQQLTYAQLNQRANQWAHRLIESGVGPEVRVGLAVERSLEMIVGLLAILKAGGAYVPLDPAYPQDRLRHMIQDSAIGVLLTQRSVLDALPVSAGIQVLLLEETAADYSDANPQVSSHPAHLAYVIYTSGSTGQPKGALLTHANAMRLFKASEQHFSFSKQDVWTLFHSYAFDFSIWEIFGALLYGGKLVIVPETVSRNPDAFHTLLIEQGVTVLSQTPSAFKPLMDVACATQQSLALRYVVFGGEALDVASLRPWFEQFGDRSPHLINMYGITETTVHVTYRAITRDDCLQPGTSPIGAPLADLSWYLLDGALNPVPKGCVGELYVGGAGLARGYLNRPSLTATRFVPNPFADDGSRLYRTGDLARYRPDGAIDYLGRSDHQVKIRGFRIELGEIQAQLLAQPAISQAVVLARDTQDGPQLVAYVVADEAVTHREQIKAALKAQLPDYMIPAHLLFIPHLPLTANGKLDHKALPEPDASQAQGQYVAPRSLLEQQIATIWQEVLKLERVGLTDNFFELGGHSLLVIKVVSRLQLELGLQLTPQHLFQAPTLGAFASSLEQDGETFNSATLSRLESLLDDMEEV
jgi:amino acid adenylation domain-containing protein/non-ribosomal peptide synthase protein (TIGR01720 family)